MKASEWIDRVKVAKGYDSDYRAAKELGITRGGMSHIRTGESASLSEETALHVAHALDLDPAIVLVDQAQERAKDGEARSAWSAVLQRLGGVAAGFLFAVGLGSAPSPASAGYQSTTGSTVHYVNQRKRPAKRSAMAAMSRTLAARQAPA